jgi:hypothetical protein
MLLLPFSILHKHSSCCLACSPEDQGVVHHDRQLDVPKVAGALRIAQPTRGAPAAQIGLLVILVICQQQGHLIELNV